MPAIYRASVREFLDHTEDAIVGRLTGVAAHGISELSAEQLDAWRLQIPVLREHLLPFAERDWHLLLEYALPRRGKRIDAVLLAHDLVIALEFKSGEARGLDGVRQIEDYCLDLRDFHSESRNRTIVPMLVGVAAGSHPTPQNGYCDAVAPVWCASASDLGQKLESIIQRHSSLLNRGIDPKAWDGSPYIPTPTILECAQTLYAGNNVREITRCHAGVTNLTRTSDTVIQAIHSAQQENQKLICFVTGVPGAGKTLAGLNVVHNKALHEGDLGVFLSGNGPLVKVLTEALARDHSKRDRIPLQESRRRVSTFITNVHRFIDEYGEHPHQCPVDRVVVFDEAQRAWNAEQSLRKFGRNRSEPETMLEVMNRHQGWAVIVALIGNGQEINTGEAGLGEWGRAISQKFNHWRVMIAPEMRQHMGGESGYGLLDTLTTDVRLIEREELHLKVSLRSYRAEAVSHFVSHLLARSVETAKTISNNLDGFPIHLTRELSVARNWLSQRQRGYRRTGLVASSGGRRLRAHGLDVTAELDVENWFLNPPEDVRSSYSLETPATEFGIQGLELDWTALCWDLDLSCSSAGWRFRAFRGTDWQEVRDTTRQQYILNKYRVLMTRAREGMVIWVPRGDVKDRTRPAQEYDQIAEYLQACGLRQISE